MFDFDKIMDAMLDTALSEVGASIDKLPEVTDATKKLEAWLEDTFTDPDEREEARGEVFTFEAEHARQYFLAGIRFGFDLLAGLCETGRELQ